MLTRQVYLRVMHGDFVNTKNAAIIIGNASGVMRRRCADQKASLSREFTGGTESESPYLAAFLRSCKSISANRPSVGRRVSDRLIAIGGIQLRQLSDTETSPFVGANQEHRQPTC